MGFKPATGFFPTCQSFCFRMPESIKSGRRPYHAKKGTAFSGSLPSYLKQQLYSKQIRRELKPGHSFATVYDPVKKQKNGNEK